MTKNNNISAVIITLNEELNIERCILSLLPFAEEIIVIDSGSTDRTKEICEKHKVKFIYQEWKGYGNTKNIGNQLATNNYIFSIDADEEVSSELLESILSIKSNLNGAYSINRLTNYCGKWIKHSGWYPDRKVRLFDKNKVNWNNEEVHESLSINDEKVNFIKGDLLHYSYTSIFNHIEKSVHYGKLAGIHLFNSNKPANWSKIIFSPFFRFIKDYIINKGFLDGAYGFFIAYTAAYSIFIKYFTHYQLQQTKNK